jgi:hypothetical protein
MLVLHPVIDELTVILDPQVLTLLVNQALSLLISMTNAHVNNATMWTLISVFLFDLIFAALSAPPSARHTVPLVPIIQSRLCTVCLQCQNQFLN